MILLLTMNTTAVHTVKKKITHNHRQARDFFLELQRAIRSGLVTPTLWYAETLYRSGSLRQRIPGHHPPRWFVCVDFGQPIMQRQLRILPFAT